MDDKTGCGGCQGVAWWAMLVVAVLAVPAVGVVVSLVSGTRGFFAVAIFIVTCWISTYLGMKLMHRVDKK
ncbi:MAG: hypothetical protein KGI29_00415 [Pseudomonadota bacterium]|nr:hypothetical protein [Pseudomonadota bacterium]MDE3038066.1 hypothetical protein [Pseudomonadota bacterium]